MGHEQKKVENPGLDRRHKTTKTISCSNPAKFRAAFEDVWKEKQNLGHRPGFRQEVTFLPCYDPADVPTKHCPGHWKACVIAAIFQTFAVWQNRHTVLVRVLFSRRPWN